MMKTVYTLARPIAGILLLAAALNSSAQMAAPSHPPMFTTPAAPVWNPPTNWTAGPSSVMVVKSFSITGSAGQSAKVAISAFPGDVGGSFANVNRWRAQTGLPPIEESALAANTQSIAVAGGTATLVDLANPDGGHPRLVAAIVPHGTNTWFFKLTGDASLVGQEKASFIKFVQTVVYPQP